MDDVTMQEEGSIFGDDLMPSWIPFNIAGVILVIVAILFFIFRHHETKDTTSFTEFLIIVFLNMLVLGGVQHNFLMTSLAIAIPGSILFLFFLIEMIILLGPSLATIMDKVIKKRHTTIENLSDYKKSPLFEDLADTFSAHFGMDPNEFIASEKLEDLGSEFFRSILIGCAQVSLLVAYMAGVFLQGRPDFGDSTTYLYYYLGVLVQTCYVVGKRLINRSMISILFWCKVSLATNDGEVLQDEKGRQIVLKDIRATLIFRMFVSALVNAWGLYWTISLLPLQLASSEGFTEFVLNAIAVFFIVELDDLDPEKVFRYAFSYQPISKISTLKVRTSLQIMENDSLDPGCRFKPTKDAVLCFTFTTGLPKLTLHNVSLLRKNAHGNYVPVKNACVRLPLQLLGPSSELKNKDPRRRFQSTETAAFLMKLATRNHTEPTFEFYKMNVAENSKGIRTIIKHKIRNALEVLPPNPYELVTEGQRIRMEAELMSDSSNPTESNFEPTKGVALFVDTETNDFSLLRREDQLQDQ